MNLPINPLQNIIKRAATSLPPATGKVAIEQERINRRRGEIVILADISASMGAPAWGGHRKIDLLRDAVNAVLQQTSARLIAFSAAAREVGTIPEPEENTNLADALDSARALDPGQVLVISDGSPDSEEKAIAAAKKFRGVIDVLYIGPENDKAAIAFMKRLANAAGGDVQSFDLVKIGNSQKLLTHIAGFLK